MTISKTTLKTTGIIAALTIPMLLIPSAANAGSHQRGANFFAPLHQVSNSTDQNASSKRIQNRTLRQLFDKAPPPKSRAKAKMKNRMMSKSRRRSLGRSMKRSHNRARNKAGNRFAKRHYGRQGRRGHSSRPYYDDYYEDDWSTVCATPRQIHRELRAQGWRNFHNLRIRRNVLAFKARQRNDLTYNLRIDRCSGTLIRAQLQQRDMWVIRWLRRLSWLN